MAGDPHDPQVIERLDALVAELGQMPDPRRANPQWKAVMRELQRTDAAPNRVANVVARRDVAVLAELVNELRPETQEAAVAAASATPLPSIDEPTLKAALRAFKKRLKLTKLDDESRLTVRPLTGGGASEIQSILPPDEFGREVWDELVRQGRLKHSGRRFYELP